MNSDGDMTEDYPKENDSSRYTTRTSLFTLLQIIEDNGFLSLPVFSNNKAITDASRKFLLSCKDKLKQAEENRAAS